METTTIVIVQNFIFNQIDGNNSNCLKLYF
jgi:hypothetical protein